MSHGRAPIKPPIWFTRRERECLGLFTSKLSTNKQLAAALGIAPSTAKAHMSAICAKLHLENRLHLLAWSLAHPDAIERGYFRADDEFLKPAA